MTAAGPTPRQSWQPHPPGANAALHRIVLTRLRHDPRTQAYYERRTQEGKTRREDIRCPERYVAREVFNLVRPVSHAPAL
ncbi:hypothetical protein [Streptomyces sp. NPDC059781]|uniref:hypothetical protein n=1 Tax=unclassified Streptomyces TaxID=2593676 RepID=UPI00365D0202